MAASPKPTIAQNRLATTIAISLLTLAACAWIATYYLMPLLMIQSQSGMEGSSISAIVAPPSVLSVSIYGAIWVLGMVAMMFPAMIPIVLFYNKIVAKQERSPSLAKLVGTLLFLGGYLIVYVVLGICAYLVVYAAINLSMQFSELALLSAAASGAILIATGIYQFTSLKSACLKNCISPIAFFTVHHKTGLFGSLRMGLAHGYYCVGCCWAFMLVMFAVGAMSIPIMAALAGIIALEKILVRGATWFNRTIGLGFILIGVLILIFPSVAAYI